MRRLPLTSLVRRVAGSAQIAYVVAGGFSLVLDTATLFVLHGLLQVQLVVATTAGFLVGWSTNYVINRYWVFPGGHSLSRSAFRYALLVGFNYVATVVIVTTLTAAGLPYIVGKLIAVGATLMWNFLAYRHWVFSPPANAEEVAQ